MEQLALVIKHSSLLIDFPNMATGDAVVVGGIGKVIPEIAVILITWNPISITIRMCVTGLPNATE